MLKVIGMWTISEFSSVQFATINVVLSVSTSDHDTVINVIDAVVAGTEKFSEVAGMKRGTARRYNWAVTHCMPMFLRPEMCGRQVKTGTTTSVLEAEHSLWRE